jgi:Ribosomal protein TL5, C-terminal domain
VRALSTWREDPAKYVHGLTPEIVANDPKIAAFLEANFSDGEGESEEYYEAPAPPPAKKEKIVYARNIRPITAYLRDSVKEEGSRRSRILRENGMIPGVLHGSDPARGIASRDRSSRVFVKTPWPLLQREFDLFHRGFEARVYNLTIYKDESDTEGSSQLVIPGSVNRHPGKNAVFCVNYVRYHAGKPIVIPFKYVNEEESPAIKREGYMLPIKRNLEVIIEEGADIPEYLPIDLAGVDFKQVVKLDRLVMPEGLRMTKRQEAKTENFIVGVMYGRSRE